MLKYMLKLEKTQNKLKKLSQKILKETIKNIDYEDKTQNKEKRQSLKDLKFKQHLKVND
jgi:hypothetical protein